MGEIQESSKRESRSENGGFIFIILFYLINVSVFFFFCRKAVVVEILGRRERERGWRGEDPAKFKGKKFGSGNSTIALKLRSLLDSQTMLNFLRNSILGG